MTESVAEKLVLRPHHWGVSVPDLEASIAWYRDMLGFSLERRMEIAPARAKVAFLKHGDFSLELFEVEDAAPLPEARRSHIKDLTTHGNKHMAFAVEDPHKALEILKKRGVDVESEEMPTFIRDNTGNLIELMSLEMHFDPSARNQK